MPIKTIAKAFDALGECYVVNKGLEKATEACNVLLEKGTLSQLEDASQYDFVKSNYQIRQKILNKIISLYTKVEQIDKFREAYTPGIINYLVLKNTLNYKEREIYAEKVSKITDLKEIMKSLADVRSNMRRDVLL